MKRVLSHVKLMVTADDEGYIVMLRNFQRNKSRENVQELRWRLVCCNIEMHHNYSAPVIQSITG